MSTPLRQKLIEDTQLHGFSKRTQEVYGSRAAAGRALWEISRPDP
jgi:hypothetical protein